MRINYRALFCAALGSIDRAVCYWIWRSVIDRAMCYLIYGASAPASAAIAVVFSCRARPWLDPPAVGAVTQSRCRRVLSAQYLCRMWMSRTAAATGGRNRATCWRVTTG